MSPEPDALRRLLKACVDLDAQRANSASNASRRLAKRVAQLSTRVATLTRAVEAKPEPEQRAG